VKKWFFIFAAFAVLSYVFLGGCYPDSKEDCIKIYNKEKDMFPVVAGIRDSLFKSYPQCGRFTFRDTKKLFNESCDSPKDVKYLPRELLHFTHSKLLAGFMHDARLKYIYMEAHRIEYVFEGPEPFRLVQFDREDRKYRIYAIDSNIYLFAPGECWACH
jgi:hypothetical protein